MATKKNPIGVFDSGYGGLTILKEIIKQLPRYDYIYLGDNARFPYGTRSFDAVYRYTLEAVKWLFSKGCNLIILACNTAAAKALRTIQQKDIPKIDSTRKVLGVIRPLTECIGQFTHTNHVGVLGTTGTVNSESYIIEIKKFFPHLKVSQEACPMWVPLVEYNEFDKPGADYFLKKNITNLLSKDEQIDTIILGCTHYPLLIEKIIQFVPQHIKIISQGEIVANSLTDYLKRHPEIDIRCSKSSSLEFYTTDSVIMFNRQAEIFFEKPVAAKQVSL
jgi:glutamate racemase